MTDVRATDWIDRIAVSDLLIRYATALDSRDWDLLASCFTEDGVTDYGSLGGINEGPEAIVTLCRGVLAGLDASQHIITNVVTELAGDEGTATCYFQAQHVYAGAEAGDNYLVGGTYRDRLRRTPSGWRIAHRTLEATWVDGNPLVFEEAAARLTAAD